MIYAMSDLHGCYEKYVTMLETIQLKEDDTLYILGDVVDRGTDGIKILQDMIKKKNIIALCGNHDYAAHSFLSQLYQNKSIIQNEEFKEAFKTWLIDGGKPTVQSFLRLLKEEQKSILGFLSTFFYYEEIEVNGKKFWLSHTVPEKERMVFGKDLALNDFLIGEPDYEEQYFPNKYIVTGHTPTFYIEYGCRGIYKKHNHIALDCGAVFGGKLSCICLNNMKEYYV